MRPHRMARALLVLLWISPLGSWAAERPPTEHRFDDARKAFDHANFDKALKIYRELQDSIPDADSDAELWLAIARTRAAKAQTNADPEAGAAAVAACHRAVEFAPDMRTREAATALGRQLRTRYTGGLYISCPPGTSWQVVPPGGRPQRCPVRLDWLPIGPNTITVLDDDGEREVSAAVVAGQTTMVSIPHPSPDADEGRSTLPERRVFHLGARLEAGVTDLVGAESPGLRMRVGASGRVAATLSWSLPGPLAVRLEPGLAWLNVLYEYRPGDGLADPRSGVWQWWDLDLPLLLEGSLETIPLDLSVGPAVTYAITAVEAPGYAGRGIDLLGEQVRQTTVDVRVAAGFRFATRDLLTRLEIRAFRGISRVNVHGRARLVRQGLGLGVELRL